MVLSPPAVHPSDWSSPNPPSTLLIGPGPAHRYMIGPEPAGSERLPATHLGVSNALMSRPGDQSGGGWGFPRGLRQWQAPTGPRRTNGNAGNRGYSSPVLGIIRLYADNQLKSFTQSESCSQRTKFMHTGKIMQAFSIALRELFGK